MYVSLCQVADTPFHIQVDDMMSGMKYTSCTMVSKSIVVPETVFLNLHYYTVSMGLCQRTRVARFL